MEILKQGPKRHLAILASVALTAPKTLILDFDYGYTVPTCPVLSLLLSQIHMTSTFTATALFLYWELAWLPHSHCSPSRGTESSQLLKLSESYL